MTSLAVLAYLVAAVCFIMALRGLSSPVTSRQGNLFGMVGMAIAVATTLILVPQVRNYWLIVPAIAIGGGIGYVVAQRIQMTALPQLVAAFHSLVGLAAVCVAAAAFLDPAAYNIGTPGAIHVGSLIEMALGAAIGAITFTGSLVAFAKLQGLVTGKPLVFPLQHPLNAGLGHPDHPADRVDVRRPVRGGVPAADPGGAGARLPADPADRRRGHAGGGVDAEQLFRLGGGGHRLHPAEQPSDRHRRAGRVVGRHPQLHHVQGDEPVDHQRDPGRLRRRGRARRPAGPAGDRAVKQGSAEDAAFVMKNARSVIIVPGYGMAVAQAQHALREMSDLLKKEGVEVRYAIHPVAGRMPGHMNVLLAEANVPYDEVFELEEINRDFAQADVAFVIGANDVTNPAAKTDPASPIYGMPILDVENAKTVLFVKRSMASGYAGVENELFFRDNTLMLFGDAKKMCEDVAKSLA